MRWWRSRWFRLTLVLGGILLVGGAILVVPRWGAIQTLLAFQAPLPDDDHRPEGLRLVEDAATYGFDRLWVMGEASAPQLLFVHGVAEKGIVDPRIIQAVAAFHAGGFTVVAPEVPLLVHPPDGDQDLARLERLLRAMSNPRHAPGDPKRIGVIGISVGGALGLHGVLTPGGRTAGVRSLLMLGTPADLRRVGRSWFALPSLPPESASVDGAPAPADDPALSPLERARRHEAAFARNMIQRAALPEMVPDTDDRTALRVWLEEKWEPETPPTLKSPAGVTFAARVLQPFASRQEAAEAWIDAAWERIHLFSMPEQDGVLDSLTDMPVFLLYGAGDPLVPVEEMEAVAARLRPRTTVHTLASQILSHVDVGDAGFSESWRHIEFMDDFFDAVAR